MAGGVDRLLTLIGEAHSYDDLDDFRTGMIGALGRAVPSEWTSYNEIGVQPGAVVAFVAPDPPAHLHERFARYAHQNPLVDRFMRTRDGRPLRISDVIDHDSFHRLDLYREVYAEMGVECQAAFALPTRAPAVIGIALSRGSSDYTDGECELLARARPHLIQAFRNVQLATERRALLAALQEGLDAGGQLVLVVDRRGSVEFATAGARRLLGAGLGAGAVDGHVPDELRDWIAAHRRNRPAAGSEPLVLGAGDQAVLVRLLPGRSAADLDVLLLEAGDGGMTTAALTGLGLTTRQAEALRWIALGRTAPDAARLMGVSPRTISKHLQVVYAKLGVSTRSQAAATAWAAVGMDPPEG